ncbi:Trp repressor binding protein [Geomicrobium sp. JCM 19055]|nr:Trp repressor binding protein [Geomicrobium sp. JCM 19055]
MVKVAIIYYSSTGTNYKMANWAKEAAEKEGAEVKLVKVPELAPMAAIESNPAWKAHYEATQDVPEATMDDLDWADAIIWSVPTRFGNVPGQVKQYIDQAGGLWAQGKLVNKVVSAMSSAQNPHGGQEATVLALYKTMFHWGTIIAAPGIQTQLHLNQAVTRTERAQPLTVKGTFKKTNLMKPLQTKQSVQ